MSRVTIRSLQAKKSDGKKITCLTAYDATVASLVDAAGVDIVLVGDSVGNAVLGYDNTLPVTLEDMLHHLGAVRRGVKNSLLVCDMPLKSFVSEDTAFNDASALVEAGAEAVKIEGVLHCDIIKGLVARGIPVMGHIGYTPQSDPAPCVKGKTGSAAEMLLSDAQALEKTGIFSLVLELVERSAADRVSRCLSVPTIGIGSGPHCDGQVLVINDVIGLTLGKVPRFARQYADVKEVISSAVRRYIEDVEGVRYPE